MTQTKGGDRMSNATPDERQLQLDEFRSADDQCQAIAVDTGKRCEHPAVPGAKYCHQHIDWGEYE